MTRRLSRTAVRPLPPLDDPATAELSVLDWLDPVVAGAQVVAIGESSHYNAESFRLRHLLLRYLVERHRFTVYAPESGYAEGLRVARWLADPSDGRPVGQVLAHGLTSLMGLWREHRELLEWLRDHATPVGYCGIDLPGSNVSLLPALDVVLDHLRGDPDVDAVRALRARAEVGAAGSVFAAQRTVTDYVEVSPETKDAITAGLSRLAGRLRARRLDTRTDAHDRPSVDEAIRALDTAIALDTFRRDVTVNVRDLAQADTVKWLVRRGERVVLAAHNAHVQRWPSEFPGVLPPSTTAGQHLAARFGDRYRVIGTTTGPGAALSSGVQFFDGQFFEPLPEPPAGTLDAVLHATHDTAFGVDLTSLDAADRAVLAAVDTQRSGAYACPIDPLVAYDALVHLPEVTPAHPDPEAIAAAEPEVAAAFARWSPP